MHVRRTASTEHLGADFGTTHNEIALTGLELPEIPLARADTVSEFILQLYNSNLFKTPKYFGNIFMSLLTMSVCSSKSVRTFIKMFKMKNESLST